MSLTGGLALAETTKHLKRLTGKDIYFNCWSVYLSLSYILLFTLGFEGQRKRKRIMSQVLPYEETISRYGNDGDEEQMSLTCRLHNTNNFYSSTQNKRAPKLGQIGRSKRGEETFSRVSHKLYLFKVHLSWMGTTFPDQTSWHLKVKVHPETHQICLERKKSNDFINSGFK